MNTQTIEFSGNYGSFKVDANTGLVVEHLPDWDAIEYEARTSEPGNQAPAVGYTDIVKVDLDERRRWYAERGRELPEVQPDGDILDVGFWDQDLTYCGPEYDWREEFVLGLGEEA